MTTPQRQSRGATHSEAIKRAWMSEARERMQQRRNMRALAAGVSPTWKPCTTCKKWKPRTEYHRNKTSRDGLQNQCKACRNVSKS